jgi:carbon-monoxide dehydrogenase small subunit
LEVQPVKQSVAITVNGVQREDPVEPRLLLVHYLREIAGLTGTHIGCDTSQCGACTVLVDGRAVKSCTMFAVQAEGSSVSTVEGLATGATLHPVQQAFWDEHGLQCGFCTPGFVMSVVGLLAQHSKPSAQEIDEGIAGNLCRCTGYASIRRAVDRSVELSK